MRRSQRGFTLVELLVATAVFAIFMIGILNLLDSSTKVAQIETSLADTQENVRFAAYHIMRTARMMGGATMPIAASVAGTDQWVSGELISNASGTVQIPGYGGVTVMPGSDVLTLRGFFEISPFFTKPTIVKVDDDTVAIAQYREDEVFDPVEDLINDVTSFTPAALEGRGIVFMGEGSYCVGRVAAGATLVDPGTVASRVLINHEEDDTFWGTLNTLWTYPPDFQIYRVGILESYTYFVSPDNVLRRVRISGGSPDAEPVAINIGGLQAAFGVDVDGSGEIEDDEWIENPTTPTALVGLEDVTLRLAVLGRTDITVPDWIEPESTFTIFDGDAQNKDRTAKWRRVDVEVNLRNYRF
jgi:prepilin-type N-terminal cleavage/methylation domain-containing protein